MADLKAAGLNPILSANAGASTPGGAAIPAPQMGGIGSDAVSSAANVARAKADVALAENQAQKTGYDAVSSAYDAFFKSKVMSAAKSIENLLPQSVQDFLSGDASSAKAFSDYVNSGKGLEVLKKVAAPFVGGWNAGKSAFFGSGGEAGRAGSWIWSVGKP